jgi:hypothetical protein
MGAFAYTIVYLLAVMPGLPLGFALFGRRHAAGWIAGGLFGYMLTALAIWAPIRAGVPSAVTFAIAWLIVAALAFVLTRDLASPLVPLPAWTPRDTRALAAVWLLTAVIAVPPFLRAGATDASGNSYYRAYFTADFVWHEALTAELGKFTVPPRNPYLSGRPIHYYWTYFLLPAAVAGTAPAALGGVQTCLKVNAVATALLFVSAIFLCAWTALPRAGPVAAGVSLAIVASSAEGAFGLWRLWQRGAPLSGVTNLNIDALSNWWFGGLRVDGLQRCFWWVPQHSMAYALGLIALAMVGGAGSAAPRAAVVIAGLALAGSAMMNPFVGGIFSLAWGLAVAFDAARSGAFVTRLARHAVAVLPVVLAIAWCVGNQMVEGGGSALQVGWLGDARHAPIATLLLSLGPVLIATIVCLAVSSPLPSRGPALILALVSLGLMYFVRLDVDASWVGFRAGQMFLVAVPGLVAAGLATREGRRAVAVGTVVACLLAGAPTLLIDAYNAQDITNFRDSPNGPWTVTVTREEREGLDWLRRTTPPTAIVQMDPLSRERSTWSLIPSFAERRMAAGRPISLLGGTTPGSEYAEKSEQVKTMYATPDARQAWDIARALRIDYLWIDDAERSAYPAGTPKFDASPQFFAPAFRNARVTIVRVTR